MSKITKILAVLSIITLIMTYKYSPIKSVNGAQDFSFTESVNEIVNPDCGFYKAFSGYLLRNSDSPIIAEEQIALYAKDFGLYHLRIGLEDFSAKAGGVDSDIGSVAISSLTTTFNYLRKYKISAIIRFSYNVSGAENSNGYLENEPSLSLIKRHISTLGTVISEYSDVILSVDSGMFGPWGEQHSTQISNDSNANNYYELIETWLNSLNEKISVTARRPKFLMHWINVKFGLNLTAKQLGSFDVSKYPECARVGVYNDGYLGSSSDWGTFSSRSNETKFIGNLSKNVLYGGEVIEDSKTGAIGSYNSVDYLEQEAFITHTSYLNIDWNYDKVISNWQQSIYDGADDLYKNAGVTDFVFVKNRLGYRLVITELYLDKKGNDQTGYGIELSLTVQNKGFANMVRKPVVKLILAKGSSLTEMECDIDLTQVESASSKTFNLSIDMPKGVNFDEYDLYLQVQTPYGRQIRFANGNEFYNNNVNALSLGQIAVGQVKVYEIKFDLNGGTLIRGKLLQKVTNAESIIPPDVYREGYRFVGWNKDLSNVIQDLTVIAVWEKLPDPVPEPDSSTEIEEENSNSVSSSNQSDISNNGGCGSSLSSGAFSIFSCFAVFLIKKSK